MLDKIVDLAMMMYEESPYVTEWGIPASREDVKETLSNLQKQDQEGEGYFGVLYFNEDPVGFLVSTIVGRHTIWGHKYKIAAELAWYVHPAYRKQGGASTLLESFEKWCKANDVDMILNAAMHNDTFDQVKYIYESNGYSAGETAFIKVLTDTTSERLKN